MKNIFSGIQGLRYLVYLVNNGIYSDTINNHIKRLREVFERLVKHNLKLQLDECKFWRKEVIYLGHLITEHGVKLNSDKTSAVVNFPILNTTTDIKPFFGFAGYYPRFITNFSDLSKL